MNIRSNVPNDHVQSISEIAHSQSQMIQLLTIEINEKGKEIERLNNIIDKAIKHIKEHTENIDRGRYYEDYVETYDLLNILGGGDEE